MITGSDYHVGLWIPSQNLYCCIGDTRSGVAPQWFREHLVRVNVRQLFQHRLLVIGIGHHDDVLLRTHLQKAFIGLLDKGFACSQHIQKLLGACVTTHRPKPGAYAPRHDDTIIIFHADCHYSFKARPTALQSK